MNSNTSPKVAYLLACGFPLYFGLSCSAAEAELMGPGADGKTGSSHRADKQANKELSVRQTGTHIIQGDVLRVDGDTYFIKELGGKELRLHTDATTTKAEKVQVGDRIEAKVDETNHALSLLQAP